MIDNEIQGRNYGWIIDWQNPEVFEEEERDRSGVRGPRKIAGHVEQALWRGEGEHFRMFDDDGIEYFRGRLIRLLRFDDYLFTPIDDYGVVFGCTSIEYVNDQGEWEVL